MSNRTEQTDTRETMGKGIAVGLSVGIAIGVVMDDLAMGIAIGLAMSPAFGVSWEKIERDRHAGR